MSANFSIDPQLLDAIRVARNAALEEAAAVVDQCNREGPYNAIGAASRIRALKATPNQEQGEAMVDTLLSRIQSSKEAGE